MTISAHMHGFKGLEAQQSGDASWLTVRGESYLEKVSIFMDYRLAQALEAAFHANEGNDRGEVPDLAAPALLKAKEALDEIANRHIPDQPATSELSEAEFARRHHTELRRHARAALTEIRKLTGAA